MSKNVMTKPQDSATIKSEGDTATSGARIAVESAQPRPNRWAKPDIDVFQSDAEIRLVADMPGVPRESISLKVERGRLTLEGLWGAEDLGEALFTEFSPTHYRRELRLPEGLDLDAVSARLTDGVLTVSLPFNQEHRPRQIQVQGVQ